MSTVPPISPTTLDVRVWQLWGKADPQRLASYASAFGVSEEHGLAWILFVVALHDLGKATPPFQAKVPLRMEGLRGLGLDFPDGDEPHGSMSAVLVPDQLERF